jgi:hypothetical protein
MRRAVVMLIALSALAVLAGCEQFFTSSPFSFMQRDPSTLPMDQRISYAKLALEGGDAETQRKAYEAIKDNSDPEVQLLASKVALGASDILEVVGTALEGGSVNINDVDLDMLKNSVDAMKNADGNTAVSSEDYIATAAASVVYAVENNGQSVPGDWSTVSSDKNGDYLQQAKYYQEQSGYTEDDIDQLTSAFGL